jgi:hypothetical protein
VRVDVGAGEAIGIVVVAAHRSMTTETARDLADLASDRVLKRHAFVRGTSHGSAARLGLAMWKIDLATLVRTAIYESVTPAQSWRGLLMSLHHPVETCRHHP